ncbi:MAG: ABC transporter permease subunit [Actinobacteria bacterium]|nr:ABC transporter permease subunit [Actinomycetota bacterium]
MAIRTRERSAARPRVLPGWFVPTALVAAVSLLFLIPFYWLLVSSARPTDRILPDAGKLLPTEVTPDNYAKLFAETPFLSWFGNSVILAAGTTLGSLIVVTMAAYPLARFRFRFRNAIFVSILTSQMVPFHLLLIPLFIMMVNLKLIDTYLGVIFPLLAHPFGLFFMRQYMLSIPQDVLDAARVDGVSEYGIFFRVVVPLVKPALGTLAILFSLESWNDLLWPLIVMRSEQNFPLSVGIASMVGLYRPRWDLVLTASVLATVPIVLLFISMRNAFLNGLGQLGIGGR